MSNVTCYGMSNGSYGMNHSSLFVNTKGNCFIFDGPKDKMLNFCFMPSIEKVIYNGTHTIVFWSDKTKTIVNCVDEDSFNKEIGLAMAISRKYFEQMGSKTPRAKFMKCVNEASSY